jgi:enoyl-CoA hydratase
MKDAPHLLVERRGPAAIATLNRPAALNALSQEIVEELSQSLALWAADDRVKMVLLQGAGDRAFCAGGDIKAAYHAGRQWQAEGGDDVFISYFFRLEYRLNRMMFHYTKPIFAFMDGITMGGGYGLAGQCKYRIVTEKTVFAMPETAIGFFPDVGSVYHLNLSPRRTGYYLGVTGNHVKADDMLFARLADIYIPSDRLGDVQAALTAGENPKAALRRFAQKPPPDGTLRPHAGIINHAFAAPDIDAVLERLERKGGDFGRATIETIRARSPTSVKLALAYLRKMRFKPFNTVMAHDYRVAQHILKGHDFYEGVRAMVIDKDRKPQWNPARLEQVSDGAVNAHFVAGRYTLDRQGFWL